jgi:hypothetical protein
MVKQAREMGLSFGWVGADGLYVNNPELLNSLDALGEIFVIDVRTQGSTRLLKRPGACVTDVHEQVRTQIQSIQER